MTADRFAERRRTVAEDRARNALRRTTYVLALAAVVAGVIYLFHSPLLSVRTLEITGTSTLEIEPVLARYGIVNGEPLIRTDPAGAELDLRADPWIDSVVVTRDWPTTVRVSVVERLPVATVSGVVVADDGVILPGAEPAGLPALALAGEPVDGRFPQQEITGALRFVSELSSELRTVTTIASSPDGLLAVVAGYTVRLGRPVDLEEKARALVALLAEMPEAGSEITLVAPARPSILPPSVPVSESTNPEPSDEG